MKLTRKFLNVALALVLSACMLPVLPASATPATSTQEAAAAEQSAQFQVYSNTADNCISLQEYKENVEQLEAGEDYMEDEVLVVFKQGTSNAEKDATLSSGSGAQLLSDGTELQSDSTDQATEGTTTKIDDTLTQVKLEPGTSVADAIEQFSQNDAVDYVQPNYRYKLIDGEQAEEAENAQEISTSSIDSEVAGTSAELQNAEVTSANADNAAALQAATNDPYNSNNSWALSSIHAQDAWDLAKTDGSVTVAVIDSGALATHKDLSDNIVNPLRMVSTDGTKTYTDGSASNTDNVGHGTHVSGIISAVANNGIGVCGVSYNAKVMPLNVCDNSGNVSAAGMRAAINYVVSHKSEYNIRVINMSIAMLYSDSVIQSGIESAWNADILTVAAAGNEFVIYKKDGTIEKTIYPPCDCYPAAADYTLSVGNCQQNDSALGGAQRNSEANSNYGSWLDVMAPGTSIYSTCNDGKYALLGGTSMAAPFVSGTAALMFAANPEATPAQVVSALQSTATDMNTAGFDEQTGYGEINMKAAVQDIAFNIEDAKVSGLEESYSYTGSAIYPETTLTLGGKTLTQGSDYTLVYSNNTDCGTATITYTGCGSYIGTLKATFYIDKATRLYGATAIETAAAVVDKAYEGKTSESAVIACCGSFYDSMSASGLAGVLGAPILLTDTNNLRSATRDELSKLGVTKVYISGGTAAVSDGVQKSIEAMGITVERVAGADATETSLRCAEKIADIKKENSGSAGSDADDSAADGASACSEIIAATPTTFQDALSMGGYAYKNAVPILLQAWADEAIYRHFSDGQKALLTGSGAYANAKLIVAGGTAAVSDESVKEVRDINDETKYARYWGDDAYQTSCAIANALFPNATQVILATGESDGLGLDALAGGALAGSIEGGAPTLLVAPKAGYENYYAVDNYLTQARAASVTKAYILGGTAAMPSGTITQHLCSILGQTHLP